MQNDSPLNGGPASGELLRQLASPVSEKRNDAARRLLYSPVDLPGGSSDRSDRLLDLLGQEWTALGPEGLHLVALLNEAFRTEPSLLTMEVIGQALAVQGEDGLTELVALLQSDDFVLQHKAAVGIAVLRGTARWAVRPILRALAADPQPIVSANLAMALGRIGGAEAANALNSMYAIEREAEPSDAFMIEVLERALAELHSNS